MKARFLVAMAVILAVAVVLYLTFGIPEPELEPESEPELDVVARPPVWSLDMLELNRISIALPNSGLSETWVKREDRQWHFDHPDGQEVDRKRWGGSIPLILSGPHANRIIALAATEEQLKIYGFNDPVMNISLNTENEKLDITIGSAALDRKSYYIKLADSNDVFSVDYTWFDILERLVVEPPYSE